jgi:hydroxyethylthiazole kinase-like uncharacterized protein yjeF
MEGAGLAVAKLALAIAPHARRVQVWAGPGNNGGDGLVAARHLHKAGLDVHVALIGDSARLPADAAQALRCAELAGVRLSSNGSTMAPELVIDALLGLGLSRAPEGALRHAISTINDGSAPVLSIDIPSGLQPDTGAVLGDDAVRASATLSLLTLKPGCFTAAGRDHAGVVWLDTLDVDPGPSTAWLSGSFASRPRRHATHKGSYGDVAIVGGASGMTGAAWLAARAALACGAGRVYCSLLDRTAALLDPQHPELMGRAAWWLGPPAVLGATTVACGCGAGDQLGPVLPPLLAHVPRLVLDADALNTIAADSGLQTLLRRRTARGLRTVLTPHPLEAARLLQSDVAAVQRNRLAAATSLACSFDCCVVLKGSGSVITAPGELPRINPTGNAGLASPGSGDVLAGWTAGLWAQARDAAPIDVASHAAWRHGHAADRWLAAGNQGPLRASMLIEALAAP